MFPRTYPAVLMPILWFSFAFCSHSRHLSRERSSPLAQIDQREHGIGAVGVLGQPAVARLGKAPQALERQKRVLDDGAHGGLAPVRLLVRVAQWWILLGPPVGEVTRSGGGLLEPLALLVAPIGAIAVEPGLLPVQQVGQLLAVVYVARGDTGAVDEPALAVHPDVQFHAEMPLLALLGLVHLRIAALLLILRRGRGGNQRGIHDRSPAQLHPVGQQQLAYPGKQGLSDVLLLAQATEFGH